MAIVKPLRALLYNQEKIPALSDVICPPYDVITPEHHETLSQRHPYNFVHILLGKDGPAQDSYTRAGELFKGWQAERILVPDHSSAIYFYLQQYLVNGERKVRYGFVSRLNLDTAETFPHEHTRIGPKQDRLRLMRQVHANLSPIFIIFNDKKRLIQRLYREYAAIQPPFLSATDDEKCTHQLWRISDPAMLAWIEETMTQEQIFIADGHHRFEVALAYRDEMRAAARSPGGDEDWNYCLAYFTNTDPRGLTILPIHRLLKAGPDFDYRQLFERIQPFFSVEEVKNRQKFFFLLRKAGQKEHLFGVYCAGRFWLLRLKNVTIAKKALSQLPREYQLLDVSILNQLVMREFFGIETDDKERLVYDHDAARCIDAVDRKEASVAFFLNGVHIDQIMAIAVTGSRMPPKSTFFYPKVASGLLVNAFGERSAA